MRNKENVKENVVEKVEILLCILPYIELQNYFIY